LLTSTSSRKSLSVSGIAWRSESETPPERPNRNRAFAIVKRFHSCARNGTRLNRDVERRTPMQRPI
jgi:hypothetical protein